MGQVQRTRRTRRPAASVRTDEYLLFDLIPSPAYIFDDQTLRFLAVNAAAISRYGYSPAEFAAMSVMDLRPPQDLALFRTTMGRNGQLAESTPTAPPI